MNTDLNEDKGLASSPDGRDVKLEIISEANANSLVSTSVWGEHRHTKIVDFASALAQGNIRGAFDLSAIEVGEIEFYWTRIGRGRRWSLCCCFFIAENRCVESSTEASLNHKWSSPGVHKVSGVHWVPMEMVNVCILEYGKVSKADILQLLFDILHD